MATKKSKTKSAKRTTSRVSAAESKVTVDRGERNVTSRSDKKSDENFLDRIQNDLEKNQSYLNLILGALIVIVLGVLVFNYFNKPEDEEGIVTPVAEQMTDENGDVTKENLPGKYTVKEGDTLFTVAASYYGDGNKYTEIVKENALPSESIEVGQGLTIPKLEVDPSASPDASGSASPSTEPSASPSPSAEAMASPEESEAPVAGASIQPTMTTDTGTGGAMNQTTWGAEIKEDTYTVQADDWLSKIAGRAYGDMTKYEAIAKANNISNPDTIEVGTVLKIPRN